MSQIVIAQSPTMTSREIAELAGKQHKDVLFDIRKMLGELGKAAADFSATALIDGPNNSKREIEIFKLPKREALILTSGYSIKQRAAIIDRWQELESQQIPKTLPEALRLAADLAERNAALENKIQVDSPKVEFAMAVRRMEGACKIGDFGKVIGIGRNTLFSMMRADNILMADNMPYQRYVDLEYFVVVEQTPFTDRDGKAHPAFTTMVTGKGQVFLEKRYRTGQEEISSGSVLGISLGITIPPALQRILK